MKKRVIYSDNGTLADLTTNLNNYYSGEATFSLVALEDYIYIGSTLPFNHFYIKMGTTVNAETSSMTIEVWDGSEWDSVAEINDETESAGATLAQSGFVEFVPDKNNGWGMDDTTDSSGNEEITGLGDVTIYDKYWVRISFSADLTADLNIAWIGQIFSNDNDLEAEFPDFALTNMKASFDSGKTDWDEQHYIAGKVIAKDLINKKVIIDKNQILCREDLSLASVQKVAQIIFNALGDDYLDQLNSAKKEYMERLARSYVKVDINKNGRIEVKERTPSIGRLYR